MFPINARDYRDFFGIYVAFFFRLNTLTTVVFWRRVILSHQVTAILMGPGGYTKRDFLKTGDHTGPAIAVTLMYLLTG
jgi:hypothetical protein